MQSATDWRKGPLPAAGVQITAKSGGEFFVTTFRADQGQSYFENSTNFPCEMDTFNALGLECLFPERIFYRTSLCYCDTPLLGARRPPPPARTPPVTHQRGAGTVQAIRLEPPAAAVGRLSPKP